MQAVMNQDLLQCLDECCISNNSCPDCREILATDQTNAFCWNGKLCAWEHKVKAKKGGEKKSTGVSHDPCFLCVESEQGFSFGACLFTMKSSQRKRASLALQNFSNASQHCKKLHKFNKWCFFLVDATSGYTFPCFWRCVGSLIAAERGGVNV